MRLRNLVPLAASFACLLTIFSSTAAAQTLDEEPVAVAGPHQVIDAGQMVYLDGTESFDDTSASIDLLFSWSFTARPAGSIATLSDDDTSSPYFAADLPGLYVVQLAVTDELGQVSPPASVEVSSVNLAPTADGGDHQSVYTNATAFLDGTLSSDPELNSLTYAWTISYQPAGSAIVLSNSDTATPSVTPDVEGEFVFQLVVSDGFVNSDPALVSVMATSGLDVATDEVRVAFVTARATPRASYCSKGLKRTTLATLRDIHNDLLAGNIAIASNGLSRIIQRFDGCALRGLADPKGIGLPDAPDWIQACADQMPVYMPIDTALDAVAP